MLAAVQNQLEQVYDLQLAYQVENFVFSDPRLARALGADPEQTPEQLLVHQDGDDLSLSLFLNEALLGNEELCLNRFSQLVEGVSHFVYMAHRAQHDRAVTLLEMELQAEVDKFFAIAHHHQRDLRQVHDDLFDRVSYREGLSGPEQDRYRTANRLAARLCAAWLARYGEQPQHPQWLADARRFYRMDKNRKLRWHYLSGS